MGPGGYVAAGRPPSGDTPDQHQPALLDAVLGNDMLGELADLISRSVSCSHFQAMLVIEGYTQRGHHEVAVLVGC